MADVTKFCMIGANKFENNPVGLVNTETPDFMMLRMQFFCVKGRIKGIALEQIRFCDSFSLNGVRQFLEEPIERGGG